MSFISSLRRSSTDAINVIGTVAQATTTVFNALGYEAEKFQRTSQEANQVHKEKSLDRLIGLLEDANSQFAIDRMSRKERITSAGCNYEEIATKSENEALKILKTLNPDSDS